MPRGPENSKELRDVIYQFYVVQHMSEPAIAKAIADDPKWSSKFGTVSIPGVHYHVVNIRKDLENSIDFDAMERYTAEYVRIQFSLEKEIEDVEECIKLVDKEEKPETWMRLKRLKKELIIDKMRILQDHELPLTVRKFKKERDKKLRTLKVQPLPQGYTPPEDKDGPE